MLAGCWGRRRPMQSTCLCAVVPQSLRRLPPVPSPCTLPPCPMLQHLLLQHAGCAMIAVAVNPSSLLLAEPHHLNLPPPPPHTHPLSPPPLTCAPAPCCWQRRPPPSLFLLPLPPLSPPSPLYLCPRPTLSR
jgi:hypothetical protein